MELKSLFEAETKQEIIERINKLRPASQRVWGKMDVAQMMAHCQRPIAVALNKHELKGNFILKLMVPLFKSSLYNNKPYSRNLPTDKTFRIADARQFQAEKELLIAMISEFSIDTLRKDPHPIFGTLSSDQWSIMSWKHLDHHLQQFGV